MLLKTALRGLTAAAVVATPFLSSPAAAGPNPYLGEITPMANSFCPRGTMEANGQLLAIAQYSALFALFGTTYGGDARTTFALPDLRGRVPVHAGTGPGLQPVSQGARYGSETHVLNVLEMPSHSHAASSTAVSELHATTATGTQQSPNGAQLAELPQGAAFATGATFDSTMDAGSVQTTVQTNVLNSGGSQPFNIIQPTLVIRFCVATEGVFPSRS